MGRCFDFFSPILGGCSDTFGRAAGCAMTSSRRRGVLLVNFGTPEAPNRTAVRSFLSRVFKEHLSAVPWPLREWWIIPRRLAAVTNQYQAIWTPQGSPLLVQSGLFAKALASVLTNTVVVLGMQFGAPSIEDALESLRPFEIEELWVGSFISTPSVAKKVVPATARWPRPPRLIMNDLTQEPCYDALHARRLAEARPDSFERVVVSFHALPVRSFPSYKDECLKRAKAIAAGLPEEKVCAAFQSHSGRKGWTEPSTSRVLAELADGGVQRVLVICPSFVVDCLENLYEIGSECRSEFLRRGGKDLALVPSLNHFQPWVDEVSALIQGAS